MNVSAQDGCLRHPCVSVPSPSPPIFHMPPCCGLQEGRPWWLLALQGGALLASSRDGGADLLSCRLPTCESIRSIVNAATVTVHIKPNQPAVCRT